MCKINEGALGDYFGGDCSSFQDYDGSDVGRISTPLAGVLASPINEDIGEGGILTEEQIQELTKRDSELNLPVGVGRKDLPLTSNQNVLILAFSYLLSLEMPQKGDVYMKAKHPEKMSGVSITREVNIPALTKLLKGSNKWDRREPLLTALFDLAKRPLIMRYKDRNGVEHAKLSSIILIDEATLSKSKDSLYELENVKVVFGTVFFDKLYDRYAPISPKLFPTLRKKGAGTELFSVLLSSIYKVYSRHLIAASEAEKNIRNSKGTGKRTKEDIDKEVAEARRKAMTFEIREDTLKKRISTDYTSKKQYRSKFKKDLEVAIELLKEIGIIEEATIGVKATGTNQKKVVFVLSERDRNDMEDIEQLIKEEGSPLSLPSLDEPADF